MRIPLALTSLLFSCAFTGCVMSPSAFQPGPAPAPATAIQGSIYSGSRPVVGAHVYLLKANTTGYGVPATSLLDSAATGGGDEVGGYVVSNSTGAFAIPASYHCDGTDQVYVYTIGGDAGGGSNAASGLMSVVGGCPLPPFNGTETILVNEITTVGAAYALAGFANDPTHISSSSSSLAVGSLRNAFGMVANLYDPSNGMALSTTPAGNGIVPSKLINTLADILGACIRSSGPSSSACSTLLNLAPASVGGIQPSNTASAILNIVHRPGVNVAGLFALVSRNTPYGPSLPTQPNDFSLGITYGGGGLSNPYAVAIDAEGNAWFANLGNSTVSKLSPTGVALSPAGGFNNGNPVAPVGIAIDLSGNVWIVNAISNTLTKYASSGALLSPFPGYTGGGMSAPQAIASDSLGNTWITNYHGSASKFSNGGVPISPLSGYMGGGIAGAVAVALDASGSVWITNTQSSPHSITKLTSAGQPLSPASGYIGGGLNNPFSIALDNNGSAWAANYSNDSLTKLATNGDAISPGAGFTGGGLSHPYSLALDGAGNAWVANAGTFSISAFSNAGVAMSPTTGYQGGLLNGPQAIAIDGSGNVWIANGYDISVTQLVGAAVPVVTPLAAGIRDNQLAARP
jgi:streptogramin lyase